MKNRFATDLPSESFSDLELNRRHQEKVKVVSDMIVQYEMSE